MQATLVRPPKTPGPERAGLVELARRHLENHPHFRGRLDTLSIEECGRVLHLHGQLPTFYLKQLAQETVRRVPGVKCVRNEIDVKSPYGISSE